jgi:hypothetical protein
MRDMCLAREEQQVLAVEDAWIDAEIQRDEAELRHVMNGRYTINRSDGTLAGRESEVAGLLGSGPSTTADGKPRAMWPAC